MYILRILDAKKKEHYHERQHQPNVIRGELEKSAFGGSRMLVTAPCTIVFSYSK
jgi:hypothetical protein